MLPQIPGDGSQDVTEGGKRETKDTQTRATDMELHMGQQSHQCMWGAGWIPGGTAEVWCVLLLPEPAQWDRDSHPRAATAPPARHSPGAERSSAGWGWGPASQAAVLTESPGSTQAPHPVLEGNRVTGRCRITRNLPLMPGLHLCPHQFQNWPSSTQILQHRDRQETLSFSSLSLQTGVPRHRQSWHLAPPTKSPPRGMVL